MKKETYTPKIKIAKPWGIEIEIIGMNHSRGDYFTNDSNQIISINLVNNETGEIRQKQISLDTLARKVFESELKTWKDISTERRPKDDI